MPSSDTINTLIQMFMFNMNKESKTKHTDLLQNLYSLCMCFDDEETTQIIEKLEEINETPIRFFLRERPSSFSKQEQKRLDDRYKLPELDFIYFRDTATFQRLKKEYTSTHSNLRQLRIIYLYQIVDILAYIKQVIFSDFILVASSHNLDVPFILPSISNQSEESELIGIKPEGNNQ